MDHGGVMSLDHGGVMSLDCESEPWRFSAPR